MERTIEACKPTQHAILTYLNYLNDIGNFNVYLSYIHSNEKTGEMNDSIHETILEDFIEIHDLLLGS